MSEQCPEQSPQAEKSPRESVIEYIQEKIDHQNTLLQRYSDRKRAKPITFREDETKQEVRRLEAMKGVVQKGEHRGVTKELEQDIEEQQAELTRLEKDKTLHPDAEEYHRLKGAADKGREFLPKIADPEVKQWIVDRLPEIHRAMEETEKGKAELKKNVTRGKIKTLQELYQFTSTQQPPVTPSA